MVPVSWRKQTQRGQGKACARATQLVQVRAGTQTGSSEFLAPAPCQGSTHTTSPLVPLAPASGLSAPQACLAVLSVCSRAPSLPESSDSCKQSSSHLSVSSPCVSALPSGLSWPASRCLLESSPPSPQTLLPSLAPSPSLYRPDDHSSWWQWEAEALVTEEQSRGSEWEDPSSRKSCCNLVIGNADPGSCSRRFSDPHGFCF